VERLATEFQYIALSTAAAVILFRVSGEQTSGTRSAQVLDTLNAVAHAVSNVIPIYVAKWAGSAAVETLHPIDLTFGSFARGGRVFRMQDGKEIRGLYVQRRDVNGAIAVLKAAKADFSRES
jgi:hypothetical protein